MSEPLVYVGTYRIREGKLEPFRQLEKEIAEFVEANEPRILAFASYISDDGTKACGIQIHPNSESMATHLDVAGPRFGQVMEFIEDVRIEIYGPPSASLRERMTQMAQMSGASLTFNEPHAGFSRLPTD
jgi:hypothetical protein